MSKLNQRISCPACGATNPLATILAAKLVGLLEATKVPFTETGIPSCEAADPHATTPRGDACPDKLTAFHVSDSLFLLHPSPD